MMLQNTRKYILPVSVAILLMLLAAWGFQQRPAAALKSDNAVANPMPSVGQQVDNDSGSDYDKIQVSGVAKASGVPDLATLSLSVSVTADTVAEARNRAAASVQNVRNALVANGVVQADISTSRFRIYPEYDYSQTDGHKLIGYNVNNGLTVTLRNINAVGAVNYVGAVIGAAIAGGGNDIVFNNVNFSFSDTDAMERKARKAAIGNMQVKAVQLALFADRRLGDLKLISEGSLGSVSNESFGRNSLAAGAACYDTPITVGEGEISVTVYGVYELLPAGQ